MDDNAVLDALKRVQPVCWLNPAAGTDGAVPPTRFGMADILAAEARLQRFAPYIRESFPETAGWDGLIESDLVEIPNMERALRDETMPHVRLLLKCDHVLPISGSIKARGGIYEVLKWAERLALDAGLLTIDEDYRKLNTPRLRELFGHHLLVVGSTGNLGLSIGIMGRKLGFPVQVHMSADARSWKKELLRSIGAQVVEHAGDFSAAVARGREIAAADPRAHFVDDEHSPDLFLGYAVAAVRLQKQLAQRNLPVDAAHPLTVYLPCGVGGGPGGITFGLKQVFGSAVTCYFAEPTHAPAMLLGLMSGKWDGICVQDIGIDGKTAADGLAVGRPSGLVCEVMAPLLDGCFTVTDAEMFRSLALLDRTETIRIEPSACAGFGAFRLAAERLSARMVREGTHVVWSTGGNMVPPTEMNAYLRFGNLPEI